MHWCTDETVALVTLLSSGRLGWYWLQAKFRRKYKTKCAHCDTLRSAPLRDAVEVLNGNIP